MRDEIFTFESFINGYRAKGMDSLEDHKSFGALHPQFWAARTATGRLSFMNGFDGQFGRYTTSICLFIAFYYRAMLAQSAVMR